jgi:hypothetical protein
VSPEEDGLPDDPAALIRAFALAIRADDRYLDRFIGPGFRIHASVLYPGRVYDSLDARFRDLHTAYTLVQVIPDVERIRVLPDGRFAIPMEAHLTRADGAGLSTPLVWLARVEDGRVVHIEAERRDA